MLLMLVSRLDMAAASIAARIRPTTPAGSRVMTK